MKNKLEFCATENDKRLDKSIANHFNDISRSRAKNLIEEQMVKVNDELKKPKYDLKQGDNVVINIPEPKTLDLEPENIPLDIVYEDNEVLVVNKPQGMVVHPSPGHPDHTLVNALLFHTPLSNINGTFRPGIVHRIDKDTSGLLMIAKNNDAHKSLSEQLKAKSNIREYVALVHGNIKEDKGKIDAPIGRSKKDRKKQAIVDDGKHAVTHFKVLERLGEYTLVSCVLETGRTHQIRVHMKYIGYPLVGDPLYGPRKTIKGNGQFLHAAKLGFKHPKSGKLMVFDAPLPKIFKQTINNLRNRIK
ncbi:RluA family pseudouridine synthase [Apilactobacillus micheneri]|uniref:RluA family pseudouridine synthase n=1 Tax=Apilactobacillus micheneri TaxID=1899430 RepID=UPI001128BC5B|nr:RluA family pseudouridine synthase [Apilactobacillus micheneri]TPR42090.1 RluA family pseudouridine synthase [Apilactobacillus micheneri]